MDTSLLYSLEAHEALWLMELLSVSFSAGIDLHFAIECQYPDGWPDPRNPERAIEPSTSFLEAVEAMNGWKPVERLAALKDVVGYAIAQVGA